MCPFCISDDFDDYRCPAVPAGILGGIKKNAEAIGSDIFSVFGLELTK